MKSLFLLLFVLCGMSAYGDGVVSETDKNQNFHFGVDGFWSHGKHGNHNAIWTNNQSLIGPRVEYEYRKPRAFYFDVEGVFAFGTNRNKGRFHSGQEIRDKASYFWTNDNLGFGYTFQPSYSPSFLLSVYTGPGYFLLKGDHWKTQWIYWQFAFKASQDWSKTFNVGVDFSANYAFVTESFWGIELGVPFTCYLGESRSWDIRIKPYLLKLAINSSDAILGARLEAGYSF
jgi:hypothetical protein